MDRSFDVLIGEWHELTDQPLHIIEERFASEGRVLLERILNEAMGGSHAGEFSSALEFARYVVDLRENEKAWSRHLGDVILAAQSWLDQGDAVAARRVFNEFETRCPWKMFVEIARSQRKNTLGGDHRSNGPGLN